MQQAILKRLEAQQRVYEAELNRIQREYEAEEQALKTERERAYSENYIGRRFAERDLPAVSASLGLHGGLAETAAVRLRNGYESGRQKIAEQYANSHGKLRMQYTGSREKLMASIAAAKAKAEAEIIEQSARTAAKTVSARGPAGKKGPDYSDYFGLIQYIRDNRMTYGEAGETIGRWISGGLISPEISRKLGYWLTSRKNTEGIYR